MTSGPRFARFKLLERPHRIAAAQVMSFASVGAAGATTPSGDPSTELTLACPKRRKSLIREARLTLIGAAERLTSA